MKIKFFNDGYVDCVGEGEEYNGEIPEDFEMWYRNYHLVDGSLIYDDTVSPMHGLTPNMYRIEQLKRQLADTDYKVIKCCEYSMAGNEPPYDTTALYSDRQALRDEINQIESLI